MSAVPSFSTNDLRSASIDYKRDHEQKKWAHGVAWGPGMGPDHHGRPVKPVSRYVPLVSSFCFFFSPFALTDP
ncbi:MAG: hypothetical protein INR71_02000 [Terriglobus roseus]|nr:hypothetical protein [Terriglobus roseus]